MPKNPNVDFNEYIIIDRTSYKDFVETVEKFLRSGWYCQGGFHTYELSKSLVESPGTLHYCQAMIK